MTDRTPSTETVAWLDDLGRVVVRYDKEGGTVGFKRAIPDSWTPLVPRSAPMAGVPPCPVCGGKFDGASVQNADLCPGYEAVLKMRSAPEPSEMQLRLWDFWNKHAIPPMVCPSCLVCGKTTKPADTAIGHLELPGIVVCRKCRDAVNAPEPTDRLTPPDKPHLTAQSLAEAQRRFSHPGQQGIFAEGYMVGRASLPRELGALLAATQAVYVREHLHRDKLLEAANDLEQHYGLHGPENNGFRNRMDNLRAAIKWQPETKDGKL